MICFDDHMFIDLFFRPRAQSRLYQRRYVHVHQMMMMMKGVKTHHKTHHMIIKTHHNII